MFYSKHAYAEKRDVSRLWGIYASVHKNYVKAKINNYVFILYTFVTRYNF